MSNEPKRPSYNPQVLKDKREHINGLRAALKKALGFGTYKIVTNDRAVKRLKGGGQ